MDYLINRLHDRNPYFIEIIESTDSFMPRRIISMDWVMDYSIQIKI